MRWLLDYAAQQAGAGIGAWRRDTEHIEKAFVFGAMGARNGVNAALVVHSGWTGVNDILSGPNNFVESLNAKADPAGMIEQLGERYGVLQTTLKKWTTGGPIPGAARRARESAQATTVRGGSGEAGGGTRCGHERGLHGEQPRYAGYLSLAPGRGDACRQDSLLSARHTIRRACRTRRYSGSVPRCNLSPTKNLRS